MTITEQLNELQGHHTPEFPTSGVPARIWQADIVTVNPDGTVDAQPVMSRATKVNVPVPAGYAPAVGDRVYVTDLNGDPRTPIVLGATKRTPPAVTGSRGGNAALASLLAALETAGLIINNTTA